MFQPKYTDGLNRHKNKYAIYKRPTLDVETHTDWKRGDGKKDVPCKWKWKETGVAILISDKIDSNIKTIMR